MEENPNETIKELKDLLNFYESRKRHYRAEFDKAKAEYEGKWYEVDDIIRRLEQRVEHFEKQSKN